MIKIICGTYGRYVEQKVKDKDGNETVKTRVVPMAPGSEPFSLDPEREAELVKLGIAEYVVDEDNTEEPEEPDTDKPIGFDETPDEPELPEGVEEIPAYSVDMKATELREIGKMCGLTFKVGMSKAEMVAALDAHIEANMVAGVEIGEDGSVEIIDEDEDEDGEDGEDFDADFDPSEAVL